MRGAGPGGMGRWGVIAAVGLLQMLSFADRFLLSLLAVPIAEALHLDDFRLGLLQGVVFILPFAVATLIFGRLASRRPARELLLGGLVAWTVATALFGLAADYAQLVGARLLLALGEAAVAPVGLALIAEAAPAGRRSLGVSVFAGGAPLGKGVALVGGGALLALLTHAGGFGLPPWRGVYLAAAAANLVLGAALLPLLTDATVARPPVRETGEARPGLLAREPAAILTLGVAGCAAVLAAQALGAWAPAYLHRAFALPVASAGALAGAPLMLATPLGGLAAGALLDRWASARPKAFAPTLAASLAAAGLAVAAFALTPVRDAALTAYGVLAFALGAATAGFLTGMQHHQPPGRRAEFAAWVVVVPNLVGFGLGPALTGLLSAWRGGSGHGLGAALAVVIGGATLVGAAFALASARLGARGAALAPA